MIEDYIEHIRIRCYYKNKHIHKIELQYKGSRKLSDLVEDLNLKYIGKLHLQSILNEKINIGARVYAGIEDKNEAEELAKQMEKELRSEFIIVSFSFYGYTT